MTLKTILVHADGSRHFPARVDLAARLARQFNAHLIGSAMTGISRLVYIDAATATPLLGFPEQIDKMRADARAAAEHFSELCKQAAVGSFEHRVCDDEAEGGLVLQSRYADMVVVTQPDPAETMFTVIADLPQFVAIHGVRPVLVLPYKQAQAQCGTRAVVAWDGSSEASRAVQAAIPLLQMATKVTLAVVNPKADYEGHGPQPGHDMALYLARHGIRVDVLVRDEVIDIGRDLLDTAAHCQADLLVMGCYGHGRFREMLLGGTTRTILDEMQIPVFMAH